MLRLSTGFRNALLGTGPFKDIFNAGVIYLYSGTQPPSADNAVTGTLLAIVTKDGGSFSFGDPTNGLVFDTPDGGVIKKPSADVWRYTGQAAGTVGWGRLMGNDLDDLGESEVLPRLDFSVGRSGADLILTNTKVEVGVPGTIDTFSYRIPAQ